MDPPVCNDLEDPSLSQFSLSLFIVVGILISYLPQHLRIINRRSSEGLSPYFVLLGTTSSTFAIFNVICLNSSIRTISCCRHGAISHFDCFAGLLGVIQVGVQSASFNIILMLFLIFFPTHAPHEFLTFYPTSDAEEAETAADAPTWETALGVVYTCTLHMAVMLIVSVVLFLFYPHELNKWAHTLGLCAMILAAIQYLPQLYTTWKLQNVLSLSIPMMCIQTPGSFVFAGSLAARLGWGGWSSWGTYILTGCLQGCLLAMGVSFEIRDWRARKAEERLHQNGGPNEHTSLLGSDSQENNGTLPS